MMYPVLQLEGQHLAMPRDGQKQQVARQGLTAFKVGWRQRVVPAPRHALLQPAAAAAAGSKARLTASKVG